MHFDEPLPKSYSKIRTMSCHSQIRRQRSADHAQQHRCRMKKPSFLVAKFFAEATWSTQKQHMHKVAAHAERDRGPIAYAVQASTGATHAILNIFLTMNETGKDVAEFSQEFFRLQRLFQMPRKHACACHSQKSSIGYPLPNS